MLVTSTRCGRIASAQRTLQFLGPSQCIRRSHILLAPIPQFWIDSAPRNQQYGFNLNFQNFALRRGELMIRTTMSFTKRTGLICALSLLLTSPVRASTPLTFGTTYTGALGVPGQTNLYSFTGTAGQRLYLDSLDSDGLPMYATLISPGG